MRNIKKIFFSLFLFFFLIFNVNAEETVTTEDTTKTEETTKTEDTTTTTTETKEDLFSGKVHESIKNGTQYVKVSFTDGKFRVTRVSDSYVCEIGNEPEPDITKIESHYESTYGFTYENACLNVLPKTQYWCSPSDCFAASSTSQNVETDSSTTVINSESDIIEEIIPTKLFNSINVKTSSNIFSNREYTIQKLTGISGGSKDTTVEGGGNDQGTQRTVDGGNNDIACKVFIDTYSTIKVTWNHFVRNSTCTSYTCGEHGGECCFEWLNSCSAVADGSEYHNGEHNDCIESYCNEFDDLYSGERVKSDEWCIGAGYSEGFGLSFCDGEILKSSGTTTVQYCEKTGPIKVESYTYKLTIHTTKGDKEAYCINPSFDYNASYKWNSTWSASKCYDSLHSYNSKTKELEFDMECGYVYILAEAKRINAEAKEKNKNAEEIFSYSSIVTAMRLFGTGITAKDSSGETLTFPLDDSLNEHLMTAGYYAHYYRWKISKTDKDAIYDEYVGIPGIIPAHDSGYTDWIAKAKTWPIAYRTWMPKYYSIYINTAKVIDTYLKNNIRLSDVGKIKCTDKNDVMCSTYPDGKNYVVDANEYFNYKSCNEIYTECTSNSMDMAIVDADSERVSTFPPTEEVYTSSAAENPEGGYTNENAKEKDTTEDEIVNYITSGTGQRSTCTDTSGLGILCGIGPNDDGESTAEPIYGTTINDDGSYNYSETTGTLGESNYLDALYLYIRALQGNKIVYEKKIEDALNQYTPVEGLTKVINDTDDDSDEYVTIRFTIEQDSYTEGETTVECDSNDSQCEALIYVYDSNGNPIAEKDHYDYCKKNYCYVKVKYEKTCEEGVKEKKIHVVVVTDPNLKANVIKKMANGGEYSQTVYVYDDTASVTGGFCQDIDAVQEDLTVKCLCDPKEKSNKVVSDSNIDTTNYCSDNYNSFDELYYGDPSMSTILNACYDDDKLKYDYTDDLNANGNDIVHDGEQPIKKYSYQLEADDFDVCKLYCRLESRAYLANKTAVRAGMALSYDIGQVLMDKKIINETPSQLLTEEEFNANSYLKFKYTSYENYKEEKENSSLLSEKEFNKNTSYLSKYSNYENYLKVAKSQYDDGRNFSPIVTLLFKECTSTFDYDKWSSLYSKAGRRERNQLIYSAYNCQLYTTADMKETLGSNFSDVYSASTYKEGSVISSNNSYGNNYAEPAMIEYEYSIETGKTTVTKNWGTTKDYLLAEEQKACESVGLNYSTGECGLYSIVQYENDLIGSILDSEEDTYLEQIGVHAKDDVEKTITEEIALVDSNLNNTIYCSGESCYKLKGSDGKYYYNPTASGNYDYTVVTAHNGKTESGKILSYTEWGVKYGEYTANTVTTSDGYKIPNNQYSSFIVVSALGYYNSVKYYSDNYTGIISRIDFDSDNDENDNTVVTNSSDKNKVQLDKNVYPLHVNIKPGTYSIETKMSNFTNNVYERNSYYTDKGYSSITFDKINAESALKTFKYICYYDVYNINDSGYTYRIIDLDDVFSSVTDGKRSYPENWATPFAQDVLKSIENSYDNILEPEANGDSELSYLEYSYTLTKEGIKKLREYNDSVEDGYLNDTLYDCEYDSEYEIFYNCKSSFLEETIVRDSAYSGEDLIIDNKTGALNGLTKGQSEYCSDINNANNSECKFQKKGITTIGGDKE